MSDPTSTRPYLLRAIHEWCADNGLTPYVAVQVDDSVQVPREYVKNGEIVLNISYDATNALTLGNDFIEFKARFGGVPRDILIPVGRVIAIYARENGQGMAFPAPPSPSEAPARAGPTLMRVAGSSPAGLDGGLSAAASGPMPPSEFPVHKESVADRPDRLRAVEPLAPDMRPMAKAPQREAAPVGNVESTPSDSGKQPTDAADSGQHGPAGHVQAPRQAPGAARALSAVGSHVEGADGRDEVSSDASGSVTKARADGHEPDQGAPDEPPPTRPRSGPKPSLKRVK